LLEIKETCIISGFRRSVDDKRNILSYCLYSLRNNSKECSSHQKYIKTNDPKSGLIEINMNIIPYNNFEMYKNM